MTLFHANLTHFIFYLIKSGQTKHPAFEKLKQSALEFVQDVCFEKTKAVKDYQANQMCMELTMYENLAGIKELTHWG